MKKIVFLIVFCFMIPIFAEGIIEVVPKPVYGIVDTDTIVVRGELKYSKDDEIKIIVTFGDKTKKYTPLKLNSAVQGFYAYGVKLSKGLNKIEIYKNNNRIDYTNVTYSEDRTFKQSLWGRIANEEHNGEEQRAVFFYPGTRFPISEKESYSLDLVNNDEISKRGWNAFCFYQKPPDESCYNHQKCIWNKCRYCCTKQYFTAS